MSFGEKLRMARQIKSLPVKKLSEAAEVSEDQIYRYEKDEHYPSILIACNLADTLGVSLDWLMSRDTSKLRDPVNRWEFI